MKAMRRSIALPKRLRREMFIGSEVFQRKPRRARGERALRRDRGAAYAPRSTVTGYTNIMDGRKTGVAKLYPPLLSLPAPNGGASSCEPMRPAASQSSALQWVGGADAKRAPGGENLRS